MRLWLVGRGRYDDRDIGLVMAGLNVGLRQLPTKVNCKLESVRRRLSFDAIFDLQRFSG